MNLFDMLANAQNGQGMDALARQFNLSQQQTQAAVEALLPAFSQGLKRNASDPYGVGAFLNAIGNGQHAQYFDNAQTAFSPQGMAEGNGILGHLFGSKDLSRAVAAQAAQATGISQQALQQMLPAIAAMIMGGLFKQSSGQFNPGQFGQTQQAAGFGGSGNPLQEIIEQMMRQGGMGGGQPQQRQAPQQPQARPQGQPADPFDNPFGKILKDMFGGAVPGMPSGSPGMPGGQAQPQQQPRQRQPEPEPQAQNPFGDNPLGKIFEEMLKGAQQGGGQRRAPEPEPEEAPRQRQSQPQGGRQKNPYDDLFGEMFETGRKQRDDYEKNMGSIFDQFTKGMDRYR
ncbi:MAG: DUF937 domain-containing protein [Mesorhizobium sp.]|nr:DUF937 domain-containing protein [Mesorhizobium sp.]MBL8580135.1 DUF937 domain-containing protein [Mesorhizobium sp.]